MSTQVIFYFKYYLYQYVNERCESQLIIKSIETLQYFEHYYIKALLGGEYRSRTDDLLRARQAL